MSDYEKLLKQIAELQQKADEIKKTEMKGAIDQVNALIAQYELTAKDLTFGGAKTEKVTKASKKTVAVKYADDKGNTWTGRGRTPAWIVAAEISGKSREIFLVN